MHAYPAYTLTYADLERLKVAASQIFHRSVSPQTRLEIIARSAGFKTYAAFLDTLKKQSVALWGDHWIEEGCLRQFDIPGEAVPYFFGISLNALISARLALSERDDIEGAMLRSPEDRLATFRESRATLTEIKDFLTSMEDFKLGDNHYVYRSSLNFSALRNQYSLGHLKPPIKKQDLSLILVSPENQTSLGYNFETEGTDIGATGPWIGCLVRLAHQDRFFDPPEPEEMFQIDWTDTTQIEPLLRMRKVYCFDDADRQFVEAKYREMSDGHLQIIVVKPDALDMEGESEGTFFSVGYYGTARNDRPNNLLEFSPKHLAEFALGWMCEIVNVVHGCAYEYRRMTIDETKDKPALRRSREKLLYSVS